MSAVKRLVSRRWILATLLVLAGAGLCIRLGIWQLDRLAQRRAFNNRVTAQIDQPQLELSGPALHEDIYNMEYRQVSVTGQYDPSQEVAILNQVWGNEYGAHLLTPLVISGTQQAILVDRGWIPAAALESGDFSAYAEPGVVTVQGVLRRPQTRAELGWRTDPTPAPGEGRRLGWYFVNLDLIARQVNHPLLPAYIQQAPQAGHAGLPNRSQPTLEISEGPHMSYALQWFSFAALLLIGYPFFIRRQEKRQPARNTGQSGASPAPSASNAANNGAATGGSK